MVNSETREAYFLGLGGMGMAPLALFLQGVGWQISGQDRAMPEKVRALLEAGGVEVEPWNPHARVRGRLVVSSAIPAEHPMVLEARERGDPVLLRGEMLRLAMEGFRLAGVAGSHGKTTTTAMLGWLINASGQPHGYVTGGLFRDPMVAPARPGEVGAWVAAELDESDGTLNHFGPRLAVITNLDWDHAAQYVNAEAIEQAFGGLMERSEAGVLVPAGGRLEVLARAHHRGEVRTVGANGDYRWRLAKTEPDFLRLQLGGFFGNSQEVRVAAVGEFNATNAALALAAAHWILGDAGFDPDALRSFPGLHRRQQRLLETDSLAVWEDYAHHPNEIHALLAALRKRYPGRELEVIFQPHRYSRTRTLGLELAAALRGADRRWLLPVYGAGEAAEPGGTTEDLARHGETCGVPVQTAEAGLSLWQQLESPPTSPRVVAFVGAGDITEQATAYTAWMVESRDRYRGWKRSLDGRLHPESRIALDATLHNKTTLRVGGRAACYAEPAGSADLQILLRSALHWQLPVFILGRGSNLLVRDEGFSGLAIRFQHPAWQRVETLAEDRLFVGAGVRLKDLAGRAARLGLSGFEFMEGIPGSLGGALRMNAGAMGSWMFDVVERVLIMTRNGEHRDLERTEFQVGYRCVEELKSALAIGAVLRSPGRDTASEIRHRMQQFMLTRKASQPREPSAGCIFKNPPGDSAGRLIDSLGLKGLRVGQAEVSTTHANFIINRGDATSADIIALIKLVQSRVEAECGIVLEPEVLILGRDGEEVIAS